jgi:hypothetical protein
MMIIPTVRLGARWLLLVTSWLFVPKLVDGQRTVRVTSNLECVGCRIVLQPLARFGDDIGPGFLPGAPRSIARDRQGRWWVTVHDNDQMVRVYSREGAGGREIGRQGDGPAEYRSPQFVRRARGDSLYVFDKGALRLSVLTAAGTFARRAPGALPISMQDVIVLDDGSFVLNADLPTRKTAGLPLHHYDRNGQLLRSFGTDEAVYKQGAPQLVDRVLSRAQNGRFWSVLPTRYLIERWTPAGMRELELTRAAEWFEPHWRPRVREQGRPPAHRVVSVHEARDGMLWVSIQVPDARWRESLAPPRMVMGQMRQLVSDGSKATDTILEIIDPQTGKLLVSQRFDEPILRFVDDSDDAGVLAYASSVDNEGLVRVTVWRARIEKP